MADPVARVVEPFLVETDAALAGRYSAVLHGSAARGDHVAGGSDVNLLLIFEEITPEVLRALAGPLRRWRKARLEPPLLMSRPEWSRATDVFPIEITDIQASYRVLRGADPIAGLKVPRGDLRRALEREFRGKLLRLRQGYAALAPDPVALGELAAESVGSIMVLGRGLLTLLGRRIPADPLELATALAMTLELESKTLVNIVSHRHQRGWRCDPAEYEAYMDAVERATRFLDQLQLGD